MPRAPAPPAAAQGGQAGATPRGALLTQVEHVARKHAAQRQLQPRAAVAHAVQLGQHAGQQRQRRRVLLGLNRKEYVGEAGVAQALVAREAKARTVHRRRQRVARHRRRRVGRQAVEHGVKGGGKCVRCGGACRRVGVRGRIGGGVRPKGGNRAPEDSQPLRQRHGAAGQVVKGAGAVGARRARQQREGDAPVRHRGGGSQ